MNEKGNKINGVWRKQSKLISSLQNAVAMLESQVTVTI